MKQKIIAVAAPSGGGKSTFIARATKDFPCLEDTVTTTTRKIRPGEREGNPYHFVSKEVFEERIDQGLFVEWARVHTHYYGTPKETIENIWKRGRVAIMDIDVQGIMSLTKIYPQIETVFILPPSMEELRRRIESRDGPAPDIELRLKNARTEMAQAPFFKHRIINDDLNTAYHEFKKIIANLIEK